MHQKTPSNRARPPKKRRRIYRPGWAALVGLGVMAVYLALVPLIARTWRATGDEPHYLLAAHSLATDFDLDLRNNYHQQDYLAFYYSPDIVPQVRANAAGQQILNHYLGLPVLIAPAYALAGRFGVLVFQAILGGLLAAVTFRLAVFVSQDEPAALLATLAVAFSPSLLLYNYLVYPELVGALLVTVVLYYALIRRRPSGLLPLATVIFSLAALPWFNRRFIPLALWLALLLGWAWRNRRGQTLWARYAPGLPGLAAALVSVSLLLWFNSQLSQPVRADITTPSEAIVLWQRLGRGIGWLFDQQRGLFIYGPVYLLAAWGLPVIFERSFYLPWRRPTAGEWHYRRDWWVVQPFLLAWAITTVAGGFWVAWEVGPRFLVVGLPGLAPLLALAWRRYHRSKIWLGLALTLLLASLLNSAVIIRQPELPYKSSLPLAYQAATGLPLTHILPDLAGYARISPLAAETEAELVTTGTEEPHWQAEAGRPVQIVESRPLSGLPFGHYVLSWPVRVAAELPPATPLLRLSVKFLGGGLLFNKTITRADLPGDGSYGLVKYAFLNPNVDRWRTPMIFYAASSGQADIQARAVHLGPDPLYGWFLPYFYLALAISGAGTSWLWTGPAGPVSPRLPIPSMAWGGVGLLVAASMGYLIISQSRTGHTYQASRLEHFVGRAITDPAAVDRRAWAVDPALDPPQKAIYGPFDFYEPGLYRVVFRMKLTQPVRAEKAPLARLQVNATANFEPLVTQPLNSEHFTGPGRYHEFVLTVNNPRRQALSLEVHYTGAAALAIDQVIITKAHIGPEMK